MLFFSHSVWIPPQYASGTANHSQSPGPMFMLMEQKLLFSWCPGVREPGTFMYNCTVFIPRMTWPTWDSMLPAETTRANAGSFCSSCNWVRHFRSSERSTLVPNLEGEGECVCLVIIVFKWGAQLIELESFEIVERPTIKRHLLLFRLVLAKDHKIHLAL